MNDQTNQLEFAEKDELAAYRLEQEAIANGERAEVTKIYEKIYNKSDMQLADAVIEACEEELTANEKAREALQEQLDNAKVIMQKMVEALDYFLSIAKRRNNLPMYGRDARNLGVEEGYSTAPDDYDYEQAQSKAREVCYEALEAGLIDKLPYNLY